MLDMNGILEIKKLDDMLTQQRMNKTTELTAFLGIKEDHGLISSVSPSV